MKTPKIENFLCQSKPPAQEAFLSPSLFQPQKKPGALDFITYLRDHFRWD